jgi:hypothetical protein
VLRQVVIGVGALFACAGLALLVCGLSVPGWQTLGIGIVVLVGTVFERWRYRQAEAAHGSIWQRTSERFVDPSSGEPMEVHFNPATGERRYVPLESHDPGERS